MPEKVRVSAATASQLSTGSAQAALVPEEDEPLDEEVDVEEPDDVLDELVEDESDDLEPLDDEDSDFAGAGVLPADRLSVR
jgi:hypothetical protein